MKQKPSIKKTQIILYKNNEIIQKFEISKKTTIYDIYIFSKKNKPDRIEINNILSFNIKKDSDIDKIFKKRQIGKSKKFIDEILI